MTKLRAALERAQVPFRCDEPLAHHTTLGIGGPTPVLLTPRDTVELRRALETLDQHGLSFRVLGAGSNLLVGDAPLDFAVIATAGLARPATIDGTRIVADAGLFLPTLVRDVSKLGLAGLEFGIGVPGSVGGALRMNAGGWGSDMSRAVRSVRSVRLRDGLAIERGYAPAFRYRSAGIAPDEVITEVEFELQRSDPNAIAAVLDGYTADRRRTQPTSSRSAGCAFRNPPGDSAGRLIDSVGVKGRRFGGAEVSTLHANFVLNRGGATAADVLTLIAEIKQRVYEQTEVVLEEEVVVWR